MLSRRSGGKQGRCGPRKSIEDTWTTSNGNQLWYEDDWYKAWPKKKHTKAGESWKPGRQNADPLSRTASQSSWRHSETSAVKLSKDLSRGHTTYKYWDDGYASPSQGTTASWPPSTSSSSSSAGSSHFDTELQTCLPNASIRIGQPSDQAACPPLESWLDRRNLNVPVVAGHPPGHQPSIIDLGKAVGLPDAGKVNQQVHVVYPMMTEPLPPPPPPPLEMAHAELVTTLQLNSFQPQTGVFAPSCFPTIFGDVFAGATTSDVEQLLRAAQPESYED